jgi:hypothetical protein
MWKVLIRSPETDYSMEFFVEAVSEDEAFAKVEEVLEFVLDYTVRDSYFYLEAL